MNCMEMAIKVTEPCPSTFYNKTARLKMLKNKTTAVNPEKLVQEGSDW